MFLSAWVTSWLGLFLVISSIELSQNGVHAFVPLTGHRHSLVLQLPTNCLQRNLNRNSHRKKTCSLELSLTRRRKPKQDTEASTKETSTTSTDFYSLGLRPFRQPKPNTSNIGGDLTANHATVSSTNGTADEMEFAKDEMVSVSQMQNNGTKQSQDSTILSTTDAAAALDGAPTNYENNSKDPLSAPTMSYSSAPDFDALHSKTAPVDVTEPSDRDSSFFKSWKYQPIHASTPIATTTAAAAVVEGSPNDSIPNGNDSVSMVGNSTSNSTKASSAATKRNVPTTPPMTENRDIASFFQNWRYQPVATTTSSTKNQSQPTAQIPPPTLVNPNQTVLVTVADLQEYLRAQGYIRQSDLSAATSTVPKSPKTSSSTSSYSSSLSSSSSRTSASGGSSGSGGNTIAFPQKTVMKERDLRIACIICASSLSGVLATTVWPNFWLVGGIMGGFYGSRVAVAYANASATAQQPLDATGPLISVAGAPTSYTAVTILYLGRRLAQVYLYLAWVSQTLWFLYKTGQLSLEYYKQFAVLDDRFQIQSKLDAMNARFVQAKVDFDAWEKENEIGRKLLATLRTAWYIEEQSLAKRQRQAAREATWYRRSRFRVVQFVWDVYFWVLHVLERIWNIVTGKANTWRGWTEFWNGVGRDLKEAMSSSDQWGSRLGSVIAAWMAVNAIGAMFAISPSLLNLSAVVFALLWPSWMSEVVDRTEGWLEEVKAKGRDSKLVAEQEERSMMDPTWEWVQTVLGGGPVPATTPSSSSSSAASKPYLNLFLFRRYDKNRYHYYRRADGSRRFYRTGNPLFGRPKATPTTTRGTSKSTSRTTPKRAASTQGGGWWPWNKDEQEEKKKRKRRRKDPGQEQWGLFGGGD